MNDDVQAYLAAVRSDFKVFLQHAFEFLNPGTPFLGNWHIDALVHRLDRARRGQSRRLVINLPPRHLKSFIVSVAWPAFLLGQDPTVKVIAVSYSEELARALARDFRRIVQSAWYRQVFSNVRLAKVNEGEITTKEGGFRLSTSVGGTLTGRGADFILIDDPIKPEDAVSDKTRGSVNDWYRSTLLSRLDDKQLSVLVLVMQRVHINDLAGFVIGEPGFETFSLPAIAIKDETIEIGEGLVHKRQAGEALHPERESLETLAQMRVSMRSDIFNAQYQQAPDSPEGGLFKRKYFKFVDKLPVPITSGTLFVSIDSALSQNITADYTAITLVLGHQGTMYVFGAERGRWDFDQLWAKVAQYIAKYGRASRPIDFVVESAGSGIALITRLNTVVHRGEGRLRCHPYVPRQEKMVRAALTLPFFEEGRVVIVNKPGLNEWVVPFVNEFLSFPGGRFDDQVDSLVQLLLSRRTLCMAGVPF